MLSLNLSLSINNYSATSSFTVQRLIYSWIIVVICKKIFYIKTSPTQKFEKNAFKSSNISIFENLPSKSTMKE